MNIGRDIRQSRFCQLTPLGRRIFDDPTRSVSRAYCNNLIPRDSREKDENTENLTYFVKNENRRIRKIDEIDNSNVEIFPKLILLMSSIYTGVWSVS